MKSGWGKVVIVIAVAALVIGCGGGGATQEQGATAAQQTYELHISTSWPEAMFLHEIPKKWSQEVERASGGRLKIELYAAGAVVGGAEVLDAAHAGTIDGYHSATNLWIGKMAPAPFFCSFPMTFELGMHLGWVYEGGGLELWQRMYDENGYNVKIIPLGFSGPETLAWSNEPMSELSDWQGLKYRTAAWWAEILREAGVSVTTLPPGELYQALDRGVLDALEFATPLIDRDLGFYEVTRYMAGPGMHQPTTMYYLGFNKDVWNSLPDDLKHLVEVAARSTTLWSYAFDLEESIVAQEYYLERGIEPVNVTEETQLELQRITWDFLDRRSAQHGGLFAETWESIQRYRERFIDFDSFYMPVRGERRDVAR